MANLEIVSNANDKKRKRSAKTTGPTKEPARTRSPKRRRVQLNHAAISKSKKPRLPRPKRPVTFALPSHLAPSTPSTPTPTLQPFAQARDKTSRSRSGTPASAPEDTISEKPLIRLGRTSILLTALHRRNKNQHRNQLFYKPFSILRQCVDKLIRLHEQSVELSDSTTATASPNPKVAVTAASIREKFEKEAYLRSQRDILEEYVCETVIPSAYVAFSNLVADSQFANLAVVLMGILADVMSIVGPIRPTEEPTRARTKMNVTQHKQGGGGRLTALSTLVTGPDQGTVVERVYDSDHNDGAAVTRTAEATSKSVAGSVSAHAIDMGELLERTDLQQEGTTTRREIPSRADVSVHIVKDEVEADQAPAPAPAPSPTPNDKRELDEGEAPTEVEVERMLAPSPTLTNRSPSQLTSSFCVLPRTTTSDGKPIPRPRIRALASSDEVKKPAVAEPVAATIKNKADLPEKARPKPKDKKKKKGNAIDDLFSGFG